MGDYLLSHTLTHAVPSGLRGLTAVFGMGTGGTPSLRSPKLLSGGCFFSRIAVACSREWRSTGIGQSRRPAGKGISADERRLRMTGRN